jgi:hypothetical protein
LNTNNLYDYLLKNKKPLENFVEKSLCGIIEKHTYYIKKSFAAKIEKEKNKLDLFRFNRFYKIMKEYFEFLNWVQNITKKKIEGNLNDSIKELFMEIKKKNKYPLKEIFQLIIDEDFNSFNRCRKKIKYEFLLINNEY